MGPQDACLAPWQRASHARGAWASEEKSLWEVARIITGRYGYAHADGGTHAGECLLPRTVDPIRICSVAAKQPPGGSSAIITIFASLSDSVLSHFNLGT